MPKTPVMKTHSIQFFTGVIFIILLTSSGCTIKTSSDPDPAFLKCWTHAFEEDGQDGVQNFRPCATHTLPAARYRNTFTLKDNGEVEYSVLAPNDAHTTENGKWAYDAKTKKLTIGSKEYAVIMIQEDLLKLKG